MSSQRERFFNNMALKGNPVVHCHVSITHPVFKQYGEKLDKLQELSPHVSVGIGRSKSREAYSEVTDIWGCRWIYPLESLDGICVEHAIDDWSKLKDYQPPDPEKHTDWEQARKNIENTKSNDGVAHGGTDHGFIFLRSTYLRGFDNFMFDIGSQDPRAFEIISIIEEYWFQVVKRWVDAGVDTIGFGDDMGLQHALPMSPEAWRKYIKPSYKRIFSYCRDNDVYVSLHSDGYIVDIIPDLIECGVTTINPQDLVNGLENIKRLAKGKVFINLDVDRQNITVFGTPEENDAHILDCIKTLGSPGGGLSMIWGVYPATPFENIEAVVKAMDKYADYWAK
ncbi:hypothetical protein GF312_19225 [Candidatus Poribacteria bacterium]|nr:hypothetical protein [Candidatus Poribacteria bacterium]